LPKINPCLEGLSTCQLAIDLNHLFEGMTGGSRLGCYLEEPSVRKHIGVSKLEAVDDKECVFDLHCLEHADWLI
jgi:hypothetical protein